MYPQLNSTTSTVERDLVPEKIRIINDHQEAYTILAESGIKDAMLLHIDAHPDLNGSAAYSDKTGVQPEHLTIANFIVAAVHSDIVDSMIWINPHSDHRKTQLMIDGNQNITHITSTMGVKKVDWEDPQTGKTLKAGVGKMIIPETILPDFIEQQDTIILDIDLDAFACKNYIPNEADSNNPILDWREKIDNTILLLKSIPKKPELVLIARSQGTNEELAWVPPELVDEIQAYLLQKLEESRLV